MKPFSSNKREKQNTHTQQMIVNDKVNFLQDSDMWQDALRVCKEYVPHKLQQLQDEYDRVMTDQSTR